MLLAELVTEAARRHGDRVAYVTPDVRVRYEEVDARHRRVAGGLVAAGLAEGDVLGLLVPTSVDHAVTYLAGSRIGAITSGINPRLAPVERTALLALIRPTVLAATADLLAGVEVPTGTVVVEPGALDGPEPEAVSDRPDRPVALVFTSGTTGLPKAATFCSRQLDAIRGIDVGDRWSAGGRMLTGTSMGHLGFMTKLGGHLQTGSTNILMSRWTPAGAIAKTLTHGLTTMSGVPTQLALIVDELVRTGQSLPSLRLILIGGGPASPALVRRARSVLGVPVCSRYSCTEAGIGLGTRPEDPPEDAELTVGRPRGGVELRIVEGEVQLRSAAVMEGYWQDRAATAAAITEDGFVRTGDLGQVDEQGRLRLVGRSKEMYVRGGYNIFPVAVEAALSQVPGVDHIAIVPRSDETWGEVGVAVVVGDVTLEALREQGRATLGRHELPDALVRVDALPLTVGDKLDRRALRELIR